MPMRSLVVDDARVAQLILERTLSSYGECDVAKNGTEAIQAFGAAFEQGRPYDLICLDIGLPDFGGVEVLTKIRALEAERGVSEDQRAHVIAITSSSDVATIKAFTQMGDAYILKPINRERLIRNIANLGLISSPAEEMQLVEAFARLCQRDSLPINTLAHLMAVAASSIGRQSIATKPVPACQQAPDNGR